jgi:hypothetical protein
VFLGYPPASAGRPEKARDEHLPGITVPMLFLQGRNDPFAMPNEQLDEVVARIGPSATIEWIEDANHSFEVKGAKRPAAEIAAGLATRVAAFLRAAASGPEGLQPTSRQRIARRAPARSRDAAAGTPARRGACAGAKPVTSSLHLLALQDPHAGATFSRCVPAAARDRQHAVALHRAVGRAAVGAAVPRRLERRPLLVGEVVRDARHPALAPAGVRRCARSAGRHGASISRLGQIAPAGRARGTR